MREDTHMFGASSFGYPREGHGVRETKHAVDVVQRSIDWYRRHFRAAGTETTQDTRDRRADQRGTK